MFNDTEVQLAQTVLQEIKNAAGSGFNYMVQGTVISNVINLICLGITTLAALIVGCIAYTTTESEKLSSAISCGFLTLIVVGFLCLIGGSCVLGIVCPEYTLINSILMKGCC